MAWIRLDDQIPRHEKIAQVPMAASWLWVCSIAHCQSQLTDGYVSKTAMAMIIGTAAAPDIEAARAAGLPIEDVFASIYGLVDKLVAATLLDIKPDGGYIVHDYLDHNPSKESVLRKRREDLRRKHTGVNDSAAIPQRFQADSKALARAPAPASDPIPSNPIQISNTNNKLTPKAVANTTSGNGHAAAAAPNGNGQPRKKRPQFENDRFVVHRWQVDELISMLGQHVDKFDLDEWLMTGACERAKLEAAIVPDWWKWLKAETLREAQRRGLPLASSELPQGKSQFSKQSQRLLSAVNNLKG